MYIITAKFTGLEAMSKRQRGRLLKESYSAVGEHWHGKLRKKHFTTAGASEYGYRPRQGEGLSGKAFKSSYAGRKLRRKGHRRPLVFSGDSETLSVIKTVHATSRGGTVSMPQLRDWNRRKPRGWSYTLSEELRRITQAEIKQMEEVGAKSLIAAERANRQTKTVTLKG